MPPPGLHPLFARGIELITTTTPLAEPKRGFFGNVFNALLSLTILQDVFRHITMAWNWVHPIHQVNTQLAQFEVDQDFVDYHNQQWQGKVSKMNQKVMVTLARDAPIAYVRRYVFSADEGSLQRKKVNGILKILNPQF